MHLGFSKGTLGGEDGRQWALDLYSEGLASSLVLPWISLWSRQMSVSASRQKVSQPLLRWSDRVLCQPLTTIHLFSYYCHCLKWVWSVPDTAYNSPEATGLLHLTQFCHGVRIVFLVESLNPLGKKKKSWFQYRVACNKIKAKIWVFSLCGIPVVLLCLGWYSLDDK